MVQNLAVHTIIYALFSLCVVIPPLELITAGFTIQSIFSFLLGDEKRDFINYHIRRTLLTAYIHCCLPFFYFVYLMYAQSHPIFVVNPTTMMHYLAHLSLSIAIASSVYVAVQYFDKWRNHHVVKMLQYYASDWNEVAKSINQEYRSYDNYSVSLTGINKVVVTNSWILNISSYSLICAQVSDVVLEAVKADEHPVSHHSDEGVQFVNIRVKSNTNKLQPFIIRIRSDSFRDIQDKLDKPIIVAKEVVLKQTINDRFVNVFTEQVARNPSYSYNQPDNLEPCLGCATEVANVKLMKNCVDDRVIVNDDDHDNQHQIPNCSPCYCRPMWCSTCMARIFAAKQDKNHPENWMSGQADCPTCRATFCVLDVSPLQIMQ